MEIGAISDVLLTGLFNASIIFLVSAGLQVVFGVQRIFNLACGSFYALGAYLGIEFVERAIRAGLADSLFIMPLILAGLALFFIGPIIERGMLRFIYDKDESLQLLLTFALVLIFEDIIRMSWGTYPRSTGGLMLVWGRVSIGNITFPVYYLVVILASFAIAGLIGYVILNTKFGKIIRATAYNKEMAQAMGVNVGFIYLQVFTLGTVLGTLGGSLVIPTTAAVTEMAIDLIVLAFAVVVIGGLGSIKGAFVGSLVVGELRAVAITTYPEFELVLIYVIVIVVLILKPEGLFGGKAL